MEAILDFGILVTLWVQGLGNWLAGPMTAVSFLGTEQFFLVLLPPLYWCIDPVLGMRFGLALVFSSYTNGLFKLLWRGPRPYWYDSRVIAYSGETSFGIPSGHSQNAAVVWGLFAATLRRNWAWGGAVILTVLIGFSRLFLGVHFITDVLTGWLLGALLLWALFKLEKPAVQWMKSHPIGQQILALTLISAAMLLAGFVIHWSQGDWAMPAAWQANALAALPDGEPLEPRSLSTFISMAGTFLGMTLAAIWLERRGGYSAHGSPAQQAARLAIGLVGVLILWMGLGEIFPRGEDALAYALRYLRYGLTGAWVTGIAPWVFQQLKLAQTRTEDAAVSNP